MKDPNDKLRFRFGIITAAAFISLLVIFAIAFGFFTEDLRFLGVQPRSLQGITGIITAPILHGSIEHLLSNAIPLLLAIPLLFYFHYNNAITVITVVYLLSGFWVWLIGRDAVHLGASGVVFGLLSFLFFAAVFQRNRAGFALALAILFLYGVPVISGFFPQPGISYEAHISGATAGLFMAIYLSWGAKKKKRVVPGNDILNSTSSEGITFLYEYKPKAESENKLADENN